MAFVRLEKDNYKLAHEHYLQSEFRYPFIAAVLIGQQKGDVFADEQQSPSSFFVEHSFGWSQIFGEDDPDFLKELYDYIFVNQEFSAVKIRAFSPEHSGFFKKESEEAERCQFRLNEQTVRPEVSGDEISIIEITMDNSEEINEVFGLDLFGRNWPNRSAFHKHSFGHVVTVAGHYASICYACAVADGTAEIDVFTSPDYRHRGLGVMACNAFINACHKRKVSPNWDCFTNNAGSMHLAQSLGFIAYRDPHPFYTFNRTKIE